MRCQYAIIVLPLVAGDASNSGEFSAGAGEKAAPQ